MRQLCALAVLALFASANAHAAVSMPAIFGDHMVLQQDTALPVWGWADPEEHVVVTFGGQTASAVAGADRTWRVELKPVVASAEGRTLTIAGTTTVRFTDVVVGAVWVASGQSNMEYGINNKKPYVAEVDRSADPQLRLFFVPKTTALEPLRDILPAPLGYAGQTAASVAATHALADPYRATWVLCTPEALRGINRQGFATVAYLFAREMRSRTGRPVGVIQSSWGGTRAESWTSLSGLRQDPPFANYVDRQRKAVAAFAQLEATYPKRLAEHEALMDAWTRDVGKPWDKAKDAWRKTAAAARAAGQPVPPEPQPATPRPSNIHPPDNDTNTPGNLFNAMISPLIPFAITGVIWYQGEFNTGGTNGFEYRTLFPRMISDWRAKWGRGDFPFLFVQLPNYGPVDTKPSVEGRGWRWTREAQAGALALPNTAMVTAIDIGDADDLHPPEKHDIALRLSLAARRLVYGEQIVATGPRYAGMKIEGGKIRLSFADLGGGLVIGTPPPAVPAKPLPPSAGLHGFGIAGEDGHFIWATAAIEGDTVVVSSERVSTPVAVRYDFSNSPQGNLYNRDGFPVAPFRTDAWDDLTK